MITAILSMAVLWCLFYGRTPTGTLLALCFVLGLALAIIGRHKHNRFLTIDVLAQTSRFNAANPTLKFWTALALMAICVSASSPVVGIFLAVAMLVLNVWVGGIELHDYVNLMALPVSFMLISGLALLFEVTAQPAGILNIHGPGFWICVSTETQLRAELVMSRALGGVSCLYFLSLTTTMSELIGVLRRMRCPGSLISLMYLIYRYIFVLLEMYHTMQNAAKSRMGYAYYRASLRTTGNIYTNLLARSYQQASRNFDAMESRCFDSEIRFLENTKKITAVQVVTALVFVMFALGLSFLLSIPEAENIYRFSAFADYVVNIHDNSSATAYVFCLR